MYVIYYLQPDDANHLQVYDGKKRVMYLRFTGREYDRWIKGEIPRGSYSEDYIYKFKKLVSWLREGKIEYIEFRPYLRDMVVDNSDFRIRAKPSDVEVDKGVKVTIYKVKSINGLMYRIVLDWNMIYVFKY